RRLNSRGDRRIRFRGRAGVAALHHRADHRGAGQRADPRGGHRAVPSAGAGAGMTQRDKTWLFITLAIMMALTLYPAFGSFSGISGLRDILLFALFAVSLDLFWGRTGILSFGHATF